MNFSNALEKVQQYWDTHPCNIKHSSEPIGTKTYFDQVRKRKYFVEPHIPHFAEFDLWENKKVLEIGCGIGSDTQSFAEAGARITAVDISEQSLAITKKRMKIFDLNHIHFYHANAEELTKVLFIGMYDLIYSFGVLHHTPHPRKAFREIIKFMGPHTVFKLMVYNKFSWKVLWIILKYGHGAFWKINKLIAENSEAAFGCPITHVYSKKEIKKILEQCGYKIISIKIDHIFPYSIPEYKNYKYEKVWYFRWMPKPLFRAIEQMFGWHLLIKARI
jgi:2-polyprenyl-3-methyl-5-hydroxy-6-metoxy-1,4-benzoquinol methylase